MENHNESFKTCSWHLTMVLVDKKGVAFQFMWSTLLILTLLVNVATIYTLHHVNKSQYRIIIVHNFAANMTFSTCKLLQEMLVRSDDCTSTLIKVLHFLEIWGSTSSITGVISLSLLQYWRLRKLDINNKVTQNSYKMDGKINVTTSTLLIVFTISFLNSAPPTFIRKRWVEYLPVCTGLIVISLGMLSTSRIFSIVTQHRRKIRRGTIKNSSLVRSQRLLKGSGVLLLLGWFPSLICQLVVLLTPVGKYHDKLLKWLICIALIFPILHPLLYFTKSKHMKRFVLNKLLKCYSSKQEQTEEFKLRVRRNIRRSIHIQPFVIGNSNVRT